MRWKALLLLLALLLFAGVTSEAKRTRGHRTKPARPEAEEETAGAPSPTPAEAELMPGELPLAAKGAVVIDALTGDPLYEKNPEAVFYPASTTKILTALLVIEAGNLDKVVTVEMVDTKVEPSSLDIKPGENYTRRQMLYGLMLKSANDVACALARDNAGSVDAFAEKMNVRSRNLGATASHFMNPHGLHNKEHYTTPHDLSLIARAAMEQPFFRKLVSTVEYPWTTSTAIVALKNHNRMLWEYQGCTGLKTGYTNPAQHVLVSSALRDGREVISVVMHSDRPGAWSDSALLLDYGLSHLRSLNSE